MSRPRYIIAGLLAAGLVTGLANAETIHRGALYYVVSACTMAKETFGVVFPCLSASTDGPNGPGYAILKSPNLQTELLVVPTKRVVGIESPILNRASSGHYWQAAWEARKLNPVAANGDAPRDAIGLAVNSLPLRTQDQLHIHVDCVQADVQAGLASYADKITSDWSRYPELLYGHRYWVRSVIGKDLSQINPVAMVAQGVPGAARHMKDVTLAVIGAVLPGGVDGYYLLANTEGASAERLLDHKCSQYTLQARGPLKPANPHSTGVQSATAAAPAPEPRS